MEREFDIRRRVWRRDIKEDDATQLTRGERITKGRKKRASSRTSVLNVQKDMG